MGRELSELRFRKFIFSASRSMASTGTTSFRIASAFRGGPIRWLILGGTLLIAAIAIGFLPVKVPQETTPPVYGSFRDAPVTQA